METTPGDPLVGRLLDGRYLIEARVARGGMASVYRATDERLDRTVAVKVMQPALAESEDFVRRFIREAQSAARLSHPNVVNVFDQGRDGEVVFLVMEYVDGRNLRDVLKAAGRLTPGQTVGVLEPIVAAVAAAHRAGIVHRDMKPENVLMATDGRIKVADFGLARAIESSSITMTQGMLIGSPAYLAPEQIERGIADQRADIYAIGVMAFELLTGRPPYSGEVAMAIAMQHVRDDIPAPSTIVAVPAPLDELVVSATRRDPDLRPLDGSAMLARLHDVRRTVPAEALEINSPLVPDHNLTVVLPAMPLLAPVGSATGATGAAASFASPSPSGGSHDPAVDGADTAAGASGAAETNAEGGAPGVAPTTDRLDLVRDRVAARGDRRRVRRLPGLAPVPNPGPGPSPSVTTSLPTVPPKVSVPDLRGKTVDVAKKVAPDIVVTESGQKSDLNVAQGLILSQDPPAGSSVDKNATVSVVVSSGAIKVPDLGGKTLVDAEAALTKLALVLDPAEPSKEFSATVAAGLVTRTVPAKGKPIAEGATVRVLVSKGVEMVTVFDERTKKEADAVAALKALGFTVTIKRVYDDTAAAGVVTDQQPFGNQAPKGSAIALVISKGPQYFTMPDFHGMDVDAAKAAAEKLGLTVSASKYFGAHKVTYQTPGPGSKYKHGDPLTLGAFPKF